VCADEQVKHAHSKDNSAIIRVMRQRVMSVNTAFSNKSIARTKTMFFDINHEDEIY